MDWARLIPGDAPALRSTVREAAQSVKSKEFVVTNVCEMSLEARTLPNNAFASLIPGPLQGRLAWRWLRSTTADFALVGLDWLFIGAFLAFFPQMRVFEAALVRMSLLGIAVLH